jgi:hypothetical protein
MARTGCDTCEYLNKPQQALQESLRVQLGELLELSLLPLFALGSNFLTLSLLLIIILFGAPFLIIITFLLLRSLVGFLLSVLALFLCLACIFLCLFI